MVALAYFALFGIPLLAAFLVMSYRGSAKSVAAAIVGGWLTMPLLTMKLTGLPILDKASLLGASILASTWLARLGNHAPVRFRAFDVPMLAYCAAPLTSSLSNDLGLYDGLSASLRQTLLFGTPYIIGRLVLVDRASLADFARVFLIGCAAYSPLCLLESRLAPQLHLWIYGLPGRVGWETVSFYGPLKWKASVFLESPLELTPLMGAGCLFGWVMVRQWGTQRIAGYSAKLVAGAALVAMLMGKSLGGVAVTLAGAATIWLGRRFRTRLFLVALAAVVPTYVCTRTTGMWSGASLVQFISENISDRRASSFDFRLANEELLIDKALERPMLGWGGWGRNRVNDEEGNDRTTTDGLWVIILGCNGVFGIAAWLASLLVPVALTMRRLGASGWLDRENALIVAGSTIVCLHAIDCIANAMPNPLYYMIAGGLGSVLHQDRQAGRSPGEGRPTAPSRTARVPATLRPRAARDAIPRS